MTSFHFCFVEDKNERLFTAVEQHQTKADEKENEREENDDPTDVRVDAA